MNAQPHPVLQHTTPAAQGEGGAAVDVHEPGVAEGLRRLDALGGGALHHALQQVLGCRHGGGAVEGGVQG